MATGQRPPTLDDVAALAGVSTATASRALNGGKRQVSEQLMRRVSLASKELGYAPNGPAQATAKGLQPASGLLISHIADPHFATLATGVLDRAEEFGKSISIAVTGRNPGVECDRVRMMRAQRMESIILTGSRLIGPRKDRQPLVDELARFQQIGGRPVAFTEPVLPIDTVFVDQRRSAADLAAALSHAGYRRFAILQGPRELMSVRDRAVGFTKGVKACGGEVVYSARAASTDRQGGYDATNKLMQSGIEVECIFACNDFMALGASEAIEARVGAGLSEIGLAGFGDVESVQIAMRGLTTVTLPLYEIGKLAMELTQLPPAGKPRREELKGVVKVTPLMSIGPC